MIGGRDVTTGVLREVREPHAHARVLARWHSAGADETRQAIDAALAARAEWSSWTLEQRAAVFLRAADLLAGPWRADLNAATMLGQSKTVQQAEIDSACEVIDFFRFNATFASELAEQQPISSPGVWNRLELRPLDGFVFAISPFNFTAIGANLPTAPALMGNTVVWKPASTAVRLGPPHDAPAAGGRPARRRDQPRAGRRGGGLRRVPRPPRPRRPALHRLDRGLPAASGARSASASRATAATRASSARPAARTSSSCTARPSRGRSRRRSCAAPSSTRARSARPPRAPTSRSRSGTPCYASIAEQVARIRVGDVADLGNFMGAVIDERAFRRLTEAIEIARASPDAEILLGGGCDDSRGLVRRADARAHDRSVVRAHAARAVRPAPVRLRLPGRPLRARSSSSRTARRRTR